MVVVLVVLIRSAAPRGRGALIFGAAAGVFATPDDGFTL